MTGVVALTADPTDVGAAASWSAGTEYTVEPLGGEVVLVETGSAVAPPTTTEGHILHPGTSRRPPDVRIVSLASGRHLWAWARVGFSAARARLVWTEA